MIYLVFTGVCKGGFLPSKSLGFTSAATSGTTATLLEKEDSRKQRYENTIIHLARSSNPTISQIASETKGFSRT